MGGCIARSSRRSSACRSKSSRCRCRGRAAARSKPPRVTRDTPRWQARCDLARCCSPRITRTTNSKPCFCSCCEAPACPGLAAMPDVAPFAAAPESRLVRPLLTRSASRPRRVGARTTTSPGSTTTRTPTSASTATICDAPCCR